jgi:hypothetical protein
MKIKHFVMIMLAMAISFSSCKKDDDPADTDTSVVADNALAERYFDDVKDISDQAFEGNTVTYKGEDFSEAALITPCATITIDTTASPSLITVDFGTVNCMCNDGRNRRGKILVSYTGKYRDAGTIITITFDNYFVNDHQVLGTKTITNNGLNLDGNLSYSINVQGSIVKPNGGGTIQWNSNRTREWINGSGTFTWLDDQYLIRGSASGSSAAGTPFTMLILTPLQKNIGCRHFVSGVLEFTITGKPTRTLNYGTGTCDNDATVTINGISYAIKLN